MKSFKKLIALVLTFAITLAYVPATASFADGQTLVSPAASSNASESASATTEATSGNASKDASKDATTVAAATTEAASANASKDAVSADASKDAASADASKEATSANATGTTETANVTVTFANAGKVVVGNDAAKTLIAAVDLKVTDVDKDGKLTAYDVFAYSDEKFNLGGFKTEFNPTYKSDSIVKVFGVDTENVLYYINNKAALSIKDTVKNGDSFVSFILKDTTSWSDKYVYFTPASVTAIANVETDVNVASVGFDGSSTPVASADLVTVDANGELVTGIGMVGKTDASGNAKVYFANAGTYYVTVFSLDNIYVPNVIKVTVEASSEDIAPEVIDVKKPGKVTSVKAKIKKNNAKTKNITISWKSLAEAEYYTVYISKKKSKGFKLAKQVSSTKLTLVKKKGTYYVKVKAHNSKGAGSYSKVLKVKAK